MNIQTIIFLFICIFLSIVLYRTFWKSLIVNTFIVSRFPTVIKYSCYIAYLFLIPIYLDLIFNIIGQLFNIALFSQIDPFIIFISTNLYLSSILVIFLVWILWLIVSRMNRGNIFVFQLLIPFITIFPFIIQFALFYMNRISK